MYQQTLQLYTMERLTLAAEDAGFGFPKGYTYFAMAFSVSVDRLRKKQTEPAHLSKFPALESAGEQYRLSLYICNGTDNTVRTFLFDKPSLSTIRHLHALS